MILNKPSILFVLKPRLLEAESSLHTHLFRSFASCQQSSCYKYIFTLCLLLIFTLSSSKIAYAQKAMMKDPTQPVIQDLPQKAAVIQEEYMLQSIIVAPDRKLAVINAKTLRLGDKVGGAIVKKINKNSVVLSSSGQEIVLYLFVKQQLE